MRVEERRRAREALPHGVRPGRRSSSTRSHRELARRPGRDRLRGRRPPLRHRALRAYGATVSDGTAGGAASPTSREARAALRDAIGLERRATDASRSLGDGSLTSSAPTRSSRRRRLRARQRARPASGAGRRRCGVDPHRARSTAARRCCCSGMRFQLDDPSRAEEPRQLLAEDAGCSPSPARPRRPNGSRRRRPRRCSHAQPDANVAHEQAVRARRSAPSTGLDELGRRARRITASAREELLATPPARPRRRPRRPARHRRAAATRRTCSATYVLLPAGED